MSKKAKLAILGGDLRQIAVAEELSSWGFIVELWGIDKGISVFADSWIYEDWEAAIKDCRAVILPLPASADGVRINCPLLSTSGGLKIAKLLDTVAPGTLIIGGKLHSALKLAAEDCGTQCIDYFLREELQIKNAVPTAEGALAIAMEHMPITLAGAKAAVVGYGRIGKVLADRLQKLGVHVTVFARKETDLALAEGFGFSGVKISSTAPSSLMTISNGYDVIFNTVPVWLIDYPIIENMTSNTLMIDLASAPGGIDIHAAKDRGLTVIRALSLPGKHSPTTAGRIIAQTIIQILTEEGII